MRRAVVIARTPTWMLEAELLRRPDRTLEVAERARDTLEVPGLVLDRIGRVARLDGRAVDLTPTEVAVLAGLMEVWPHWRARDALADDVWRGSTPATAAESVRLYVSYLRRKLGRDRIATKAGWRASGAYRLVLDAEARAA